MLHRFQEVSLSFTHRWKDESGKRRQKTKKFSQTINPWNVNDEGNPRTYAEIMVELRRLGDAWLAEQKEGA